MNKYKTYVQEFGSAERVSLWIDTVLTKHLKTNQEKQDEIEHIIDYLSATDKDIKGMSYEDAKKNAELWSKAQQKKGRGIKESVTDTEVVLDFGDGFKIVKLIGENAYKREGAIMGHCVASYYGKGKEIFSLRDAKNIPHCTIEKGQQIKGRGNGDVVGEYVGYIVRFLESIGMTVGDNEMKHLGYFNAEKLKAELHKDTKYFNQKYLPLGATLIGKDGKEFFSFDLLDYKPLVSEKDGILKLNFELPSFIKLSFEHLWSQIKTSATNASVGDYATNASSGNCATNASSGYGATNASSGNGATNEMATNSISVDAGDGGKVKGKVGSWFCLSEWSEDGRTPLCVKAAKIDGILVKEDTWYTLKNGEFVIVND